MHIPDNYLSPATCGIMFAVAAPVVGVSIKRVKVQLKERRELAPMLGIASSLSFLMMMFNVPVPGGTTAHAVGGTLLAILIGPEAACLAVTVALILQAFLFGDGGILSLGLPGVQFLVAEHQKLCVGVEDLLQRVLNEIGAPASDDLPAEIRGGIDDQVGFIQFHHLRVVQPGGNGHGAQTFLQTAQDLRPDIGG